MKYIVLCLVSLLSSQVFPYDHSPLFHPQKISVFSDGTLKFLATDGELINIDQQNANDIDSLQIKTGPDGQPGIMLMGIKGEVIALGLGNKVALDDSGAPVWLESLMADAEVTGQKYGVGIKHIISHSDDNAEMKEYQVDIWQGQRVVLSFAFEIAKE